MNYCHHSKSGQCYQYLNFMGHRLLSLCTAGCRLLCHTSWSRRYLTVFSTHKSDNTSVAKK